VTSAPKAVRAPFLPKLLSAGLAVVPAVAVGLPLLAAGSTLAGGALLAASAALMALPFLGQSAPRPLRAVPGAAVVGLGGLALFAAFTGGAPYWMGALVAVGGWGLTRYGLKTSQEDSYDQEKVLSAYFGGIGAVALAGLALAGPALLAPAWAGVLALAAHGWFLTGTTVASAGLSALLLLNLPGWVGEGMENAFRGVYLSGEAVWRVLGSLKRDTVLYDRLQSFTHRQLDRSPWNAIWLSGVWIPVWVGEAAMFTLSLAGGLAFGAALAPTMFLWAGVHSLWEKSAATRFLAAWNRFVFDWAVGSKTRVYNPAAKPLAALANSTHGVVSIAAGLVLRVLQLAWLAGSLIAFPFVWAAGLFRAFGQAAGPYDYAKHDPSSLRVDLNDRPDVPRPEDPTDPSAPGKSTFVPRLIAAGIAAAPLYFLGLPLLAAPGLGELYAAAGLALAAMPFIPAASPKLVKQLPGWLLVGLGVLGAAAVPYFLPAGMGILELAGHNALWMGLVTALSGWGLVRYTGSLGAKDGQKWFSVDDPEYIGAYFGALGVLTGLGVSLLGMTGWLPLTLKVAGYATSALLLMHLPSWMGQGLQAAAEGGWHSIRAFGRVASFWRDDTKFYSNMRRHASYWLGKSVWNGTWLSAVWVPTWAVMLVEEAAALVLGAAYGLLRAPLDFVWGAAYGLSHDAKATRFIAGFARGTFMRLEGSKKARLDRWLAPLVPAMNEASPVTGRPTLKAALAFLGAHVVELGWLLSVTVGAPVMLLLALADGVRNAAGPKVKPGPGQWAPDQDDPGTLY
ncbi:MAG: hypothetical protein KGL53_15735, partial [Elusimicrobia bacterium]|nr:hypothetical protein [Elusimicrobiota bacterium]